MTGPRELRPVSRACAGAAGLGRPRAQPARVGNASAPIARRPLAADAETQALLGFENDLGFIIMHTNYSDDIGCGLRVRVRRLRDPSHTGIRVVD